MKQKSASKPFEFTARIAKGLHVTISWGGGTAINCEWNPYKPERLSRQMRNRYDSAMRTAANLIQERKDNPPRMH